MSKGSKQRPKTVDDKTFSDNWDNIFKKENRSKYDPLQELVDENEQLGLYEIDIGEKL